MRLSRIKSFINRLKSKALVLMYHRINTPISDPWDLSVSPENFEGQIKFLKRNYPIVSIGELAHQIQKSNIKKNSIAITFDDGYLDNFETARPILEKYSVPATFFITDGYLGNTQSFWWDELENIIVQTSSLPKIFSISFKGKTIEFNLADETDLNDELRIMHSNFKAMNPPTLRTELYLKLWELCSPLTRPEQAELMEQIRDWAGLSDEQARTEGTMSAEQVKILSENPLFTIGGHTKNHLELASHPPEIQESEINDNHMFLEKLLNKNINYFAYPSGNYNDITIEILKNRYTAAFTTHSAPVTKHTGLFEISRVQVKDWKAEEFEASMHKRFK